MSNDDAIDTLNDLIEISKDGEYGFSAAAEHAKAPALQAMLTQRASDCAAGARELQAQVEQLGGEPDTGGSAGGAMHRGWVSVKATLAGHTDLALLEECERGEDKALARYRDACQEALPPAAMAVVERQRQGVQANHDQIRDQRNRLRDSA